MPGNRRSCSGRRRRSSVRAFRCPGVCSISRMRRRSGRRFRPGAGSRPHRHPGQQRRNPAAEPLEQSTKRCGVKSWIPISTASFWYAAGCPGEIARKAGKIINICSLMCEASRPTVGRTPRPRAGVQAAHQVHGRGVGEAQHPDEWYWAGIHLTEMNGLDRRPEIQCLGVRPHAIRRWGDPANWSDRGVPGVARFGFCERADRLCGRRHSRRAVAG